MKQVLLVFLGGGLGSALRYVIGKAINSPASSIPLGTFTVNMLGSLFIGLILGFALRHSTESTNTVLFLAVGLCGGFTTFSAFAFGNYELLKNGEFWNFSLYAFGSLFLGVSAVIVGIWISKLF